MPVPQLTKAGLLPVGIHDASLSEIEQAFGLVNDPRIELFKNLKAFCEELAVFGSLIKQIFVDGSFVTSKPVPGDIDLVVVHDEDDFLALDDHPNAEFLYEDRAFARYKFDLFVECDADTMVRTFQKVSTEFALENGLAAGHPKGILRVKR
jgi:predicted nucleotidyltransferase